jgi:hypothetical protein
VREAAALVLVVTLVRQFRGQTVPGELLNVAGPFRLPVVERVWAPSPFPARDSQPDVLVEGDTGRWVVEVKAGRELGSDALEHVAAYSRAFSATVWLIVFASIPDALKTLARQRRILLTGAAELSTLSLLLAA